VRPLLRPLFVRSACAQPATVVAYKTFHCAALAPVRSVGVGSSSHCGGGHNRLGRCSGISWLGLGRISQRLW
jgi:hypothetical protein